MSVKQLPNLLYGLPQPLTASVFPPIVSKRNPATNDFAPIGSVWVNTVTPAAFMLIQISSNVADWIQIQPSGSAANFTSLTVTPGLTTLAALTQVGTANINATGAAVTNIGRGTGVVNIGNATGNINATGTFGVTGAITATLSIFSSTGAVGGIEIVATGDLGNGFVSETSITNVSVAAAGTSAGMVVQTSAGAGVTASAGFIKCYVGITPVYIPYWTQTT